MNIQETDTSLKVVHCLQFWNIYSVKLRRERFWYELSIMDSFFSKPQSNPITNLLCDTFLTYSYWDIIFAFSFVTQNKNNFEFFQHIVGLWDIWHSDGVNYAIRNITVYFLRLLQYNAFIKIYWNFNLSVTFQHYAHQSNVLLVPLIDVWTLGHMLPQNYHVH